MKDKKSFLMYENWAILIANLPDEQAGKLMKAICDYQLGNEVSIDDPIVNAMWLSILPKMEEDEENYENAKKARSEAGKKAMAKRWNSKANNKEAASDNSKAITKDSTVITKDNSLITADNKGITKITVNDNVTDNVTVNDKDKNMISSDEDIRDTAVPRKDSKAEVQKVVDAWNTLPSPVPKIQKMVSGSPRETQLKARIRQYGLDDVLKAVEKVKASPFLLGQRTDFVIRFDWFIGPKNFAKVLDGNYDDARRTSHSRDKPSDMRVTAYSDYESDYNYDDLERQLANCENN